MHQVVKQRLPAGEAAAAAAAGDRVAVDDFHARVGARRAGGDARRGGVQVGADDRRDGAGAPEGGGAGGEGGLCIGVGLVEDFERQFHQGRGVGRVASSGSSGIDGCIGSGVNSASDLGGCIGVGGSVGGAIRSAGCRPFQASRHASRLLLSYNCVGKRAAGR